jgi:hypothetical protein
MPLTDTAKSLLDTIDALPEVERHEIFREVLRRVVLSEHNSPNDEDLVSAADEVFLSLDRTETEE